jgi:hypothetical protein
MNDSNGTPVNVNADGQALTYSIALSPLHAASMKGDAYSWNAVSADIDTGDTALLVRNDSDTRYLIIHKVYCWADVAASFDVHTTDGAVFTAAGTAVTGVNLNRANTRVADATAFGDESANTQGNILITLRSNELETDQFAVGYDFEGGLILGKNGVVAVDIIGESAAYECTIIGYFLDI